MLREHRHVVASIRLTSENELVVTKLRKLGKEGLQARKVVVHRHRVIIVRRARSNRETNLRRAFNVEDVRVRVPSIRIVHQITLGVRIEGTILRQQTSQRGASRATVEPSNHGIRSRARLSFKEPEPIKSISHIEGKKSGQFGDS